MKYLLVVLLLSVSVFAQNFKQVKIYTNDFRTLQNAGIEITEFFSEKDNSILTFMSDEEFRKLVSSGINYEVLIDDMMEYYNNLPKLTESEKQSFLDESRTEYNVTGFTYGSMGGFYIYTEIIRDLDSMYARYPNLITQKQVIGTTHEGRSIYGVKISDNPNVNEDEPGVGFDALVHAREPQSMATLMYFMWYLLENYGIDPAVTYLVNNRQIFCVPIFNPDGYEYNRQTYPNGNGMWRKNRRNNSGSYGVDLNRNFGYMWGYDNIGSSNVPSSETYRGPSAFSEPEAQAVRDWVIGKNIRTYFNMHSWQDAILYPWGYINGLTPDTNTYIEFASDMCALNNYSYGNSYQVLGYTSNGSVRDWLYGEQTVKGKIFGYTIEIGNASDDFWPPQSRIFPIAQQNVRSNLYQCWVAGDYVKAAGVQLNPDYLNPGDTTDMEIILRNKGLVSAYGLSVQVNSLSSYAQIVNGNLAIDSVQARTNFTTQSSAKIFLASNTPVTQIIPLEVIVNKGGDLMSRDTLKLVAGVPVFSFFDNSPLIDSLWVVTATPTTPKWENTTTTFFSAPHSYADSKTGNYVNNATVTMTSKNPINLTGVNLPYLTFMTKHNIESNWDCGVVQVSTDNGTTWTSISGLLTVPASGSGKQVPAGMPVYEGSRLSWTKELMNLSTFANSQIKIRFQLRTDGSSVFDGWYLDDIGIYYYTIIPVELVSFNVELQKDGRLVTWKTATEENNYGFEIQRSSDRENWSTAGFVAGRGTTTEPSVYTYKDQVKDPNTIYYRLKQIDFNGTFTFSEIIESAGTIITDYSLEQNYPNPFNPTTTIEFSLPAENKVTLKIYDLHGSEVATILDETKPAGVHKINFDASKFSTGVYFFRLNSGGKLLTRKMLLIK